MRYSLFLVLFLVSCLGTKNQGPFYGPENVWYHADPADVPEEGDCGFTEGKRVCNMEFIDQNGDSVQLYQFAGKVVVLDVFANWCGPCQEAALSGEGNSFNELYSDDAVFIGVMVDGSNGIPSLSELEDWASYFGSEYPLVSDINGEAAELVAGGFPTYVILDREMVIIDGNLFPFRVSAVTREF